MQARYDAERAANVKKAEQAEKKANEDGVPADRAMREENVSRQTEFNLQNALDFLGEARRDVELGEDGQAIQQLHSMRYGSLMPEEAKSGLDIIIQKVREEYTAKAAAYRGEIDIACQQAGEEALKAKEPKDLDQSLQDLVKLAHEPLANRYREDDNGRDQNKLQAAVRFVSNWQDYLVASRRNDDKGITDALRNLADSSSGPLLIPRSAILALQPAKDMSSDPPRPTPRPVERPQGFDRRRRR